MFKRVSETLRKPGTKGAVQGKAPTMTLPQTIEFMDEEQASLKPLFSDIEKKRLLDRWLDKVVHASGSETVFYTILTALATWALLGIRFGRSDSWQVVISDVQAILCYVFDSFLVRQQTNMYGRDVVAAAQLQSRIQSHLRMLSKVQGQLTEEQKTHLSDLCKREILAVETADTKHFPTEGRFGFFITTVSHILGHIVLVGLFWVGIFVWIGIGPMFDFSDSWQLYMNSASSALMVLYFAFLANIRERHSAYNEKCLAFLFTIDSYLEAHLRDLTDDKQSNPQVIIPPPKVNKLQRAIFYYADFVGTLVGIAILVTVIIAWLATGPVFRFSSDWWLFIGTYAGLVGMHDGFVLRNLQARLTSYVDQGMDVLHQADKDIFLDLGLPFPEVKDREQNLTVSERVSIMVGRVSSHELVVLAGVLTIIGLLIGASAMRWTLTGQLLCNVPPSIIESFLMMILVTGHNLDDDRKRVELQTLYARRAILLKYVHNFKKSHEFAHTVTVHKESDPRDRVSTDAAFLHTVARN